MLSKNLFALLTFLSVGGVSVQNFEIKEEKAIILEKSIQERTDVYTINLTGSSEETKKLREIGIRCEKGTMKR